MRAIGLDLGTKRIGVAVSDFSGTIASPHSVIQRSKSLRLDHQKILDLVIEEEAEIVIVGLPLLMSGTHGPAAKAATTEAKRLSTVLSVPVEMFDERMTTVAADRVGPSVPLHLIDPSIPEPLAMLLLDCLEAQPHRRKKLAWVARVLASLDRQPTATAN